MFAYRTPGVYLERSEPPALVRALRTDVAGFVGVAARGPLHRPVRVEGWPELVAGFGGHTVQGYLAYAVEGFFANGGRRCWVVRAADPARARRGRLDLLDADGRPTLRLEATSPGVWAGRLRLRMLGGLEDRFTLTLELPDGASEVWPDLSVDPSEPRYAPLLLNPDKTAELKQAAERCKKLGKTPPPIADAGLYSRLVEVRVLAPVAVSPSLPDLHVPDLTADLPDDAGRPTIRVRAMGTAVWSGRATVVVERSPGSQRFDLTLRRRDDEQRWQDVSMDPSDGSYVEKLANDPTADLALRFCDLATSAKPPYRPPRVQVSDLEPHAWQLLGGRDGLSSLEPRHLSGRGAPAGESWGLAALERVDEVSVVALPDIQTRPVVDQPTPPVPEVRCDVLDAEPELPPLGETAAELAPAFDDDQVAVLEEDLVGHCLRLADRFAVLDVPRTIGGTEVDPERALAAWRNRFDSKYAALYYPWLRVSDPLRLAGLLRDVPPSGHVAGVYARVDLRTGVHKPPANELLRGADDLTFAVGDAEHGRLNSGGVNALIAYPGRGLRVAGARTVASDSEWRYVNVRRLLLMIREAIDGETQWTVFEPHNPDLWRDVERVVRGFLDRLWRRGMLDGKSAEEAYEVTCDETTNPPEAQELGRVVCTVGVLPPWPAEFVVVRLGKTEGGVEILAEGRGHG